MTDPRVEAVADVISYPLPISDDAVKRAERYLAAADAVDSRGPDWKQRWEAALVREDRHVLTEGTLASKLAEVTSERDRLLALLDPDSEAAVETAVRALKAIDEDVWRRWWPAQRNPRIAKAILAALREAAS